MVLGSEPVDHGDFGAVRQVGHGLVRTRPHDDAVHVPREHPGGIPHRLAPRQLKLIAAQNQWRAAQLRHPHLERHARPSRGLLEHQGNASVGERVASLPHRPAGLQLRRAIEERVQLIARELFTGRNQLAVSELRHVDVDVAMIEALRDFGREHAVEQSQVNDHSRRRIDVSPHGDVARVRMAVKAVASAEAEDARVFFVGPIRAAIPMRGGEAFHLFSDVADHSIPTFAQEHPRQAGAMRYSIH